MSKYLFIAEKPSAMREFSAVYNKHASTINKQLGVDAIDFVALRGHLFRNQEPKEYEQWAVSWRKLYDEHLPMIPETWKIQPIDSAKQVIKDLKTKLKEGYDGIIVGTDSDVEGYGIYYMVMEALGLRKYKTLRFFEKSMTEKDILQSFRDMTDLFADPKHSNSIECYRARSMSDWIFGMNGTVLYSTYYAELTRYGSVKSPTMLMLYLNDESISNFQQITTYGIKSHHPDGDGFESILLNEDDKKDRSFDSKAAADDFAADLAMQATVKSYTKKTHSTKAPKLYALSDLQVDAAKAPYGYSPDKTLEIAQKLYEERKILTYPRTSGNYLSSGKAKDFPDLLAAIKDIPDIKPFVLKVENADIVRAQSDSNIINDKEVAKASHDALIPTGKVVDWDSLTKPEQDIFLLVAKRFLAHFMPLFTEEKYTLMLENNGHPFKADGRMTVENGFNELYGKVSKDVIIPEYKTGDIIEITQNEVYEKQSKPPARYTLGTIISAMRNIGSQIEDPKLKKLMKESQGIGTEATRSTILKELQDTGYISVSSKNNAIYITDAGKRYVEHIRREKEDGTFDYGIADPVQVAYWSAQYKEVQLGEQTVDQVMDKLYKYINKKIEDVKSGGEPAKRLFGSAAVEAGLPPCPLCGGKVSSGKFGYYCSTYKESGCKLSIPNEMASKKLTDNQKKGLLQGKKISVKGFKSKAGKDFDADIVLNKETGKVEFDFSSPKKSFQKKK